MLPLQLWAIFSSTLLFKFGCTVLFQFYMIICWAIVLIVSTFQLNNVSQYSGFLAQVFIVLLSQTMLLTWGSNMHIEPIFFPFDSDTSLCYIWSVLMFLSGSLQQEHDCRPLLPSPELMHLCFDTKGMKLWISSSLSYLPQIHFLVVLFHSCGQRIENRVNHASQFWIIPYEISSMQ